MSSLPDAPAIAPLRRRSHVEAILAWNRRIHYFLGLYLLFFTWLFVFTGLLLNHPRWQFAQFWPNRVQSSTEHVITVNSAGSDVEQARSVMRQIGLAGEIQWPANQPVDGPLTFQVSRPGLVNEVKADLRHGRAIVQSNRLNAWGVIHLLHTFTGAPATDTRNQRDWMLTTVWALSMDAVAFGLIVMVFSSYIMWYRLRAKRRGGIVALVLGLATCVAVIAGLAGLM